MANDKIKIVAHLKPQDVELEVNEFLAQLHGQVIKITPTFSFDAKITVYNVMIHYKEAHKPEPENELTEEDRISNGEILERALGL